MNTSNQNDTPEPDRPGPDTLLGLREIAVVLNVVATTPQQWGARRELPTPSLYAVPVWADPVTGAVIDHLEPSNSGHKPLWRFADIKQWAKNTDRWPGWSESSVLDRLAEYWQRRGDANPYVTLARDRADHADWYARQVHALTKDTLAAYRAAKNAADTSNDEDRAALLAEVEAMRTPALVRAQRSTAAARRHAKEARDAARRAAQASVDGNPDAAREAAEAAEAAATQAGIVLDKLHKPKR